MKNRLWMVMAVAGVALIGCSSNHSPPAASTPPSNTSPTDFADFVNQQVVTQPAFGVAPASTVSLTLDTALGNPEPFAGVSFGMGDKLPAGTNQAAVACTQAGTMACNPGVSADLNSNLN